jgi:hypothetical protein
MKRRWRYKRHWDWAKDWGSLLNNLFPAEACEAVAATLRIELRGPLALRGPGKRAYTTAFNAVMQSYGNVPPGLTGVQRRGNWIQTTSRASLDAILACFGIELQDVIDAFGMPAENESKEIDLHDAVCVIDPAYNLKTAAEIAA